MPSGRDLATKSGTKKSGNFRLCFWEKSKIFVPVLAKNSKFSCPNWSQTPRKRLQNEAKKQKSTSVGTEPPGFGGRRIRRPTPYPLRQTDMCPDILPKMRKPIQNRKNPSKITENASESPNPIQNRRSRSKIAPKFLRNHQNPSKIAKTHPKLPKSLPNRQNPSKIVEVAPKSPKINLQNPRTP